MEQASYLVPGFLCSILSLWAQDGKYYPIFCPFDLLLPRFPSNQPLSSSLTCPPSLHPSLPRCPPPPCVLRRWQWDLLGILAYWGLLDALPLGIVLAHNRMAPLSTSAGERRRVNYRQGPSASEEEPLIAGTLFGSHVEDDNPFAESRPGVHL